MSEQKFLERKYSQGKTIIMCYSFVYFTSLYIYTLHQCGVYSIIFFLWEFCSQPAGLDALPFFPCIFLPTCRFLLWALVFLSFVYIPVSDHGALTISESSIVATLVGCVAVLSLYFSTYLPISSLTVGIFKSACVYPRFWRTMERWLSQYLLSIFDCSDSSLFMWLIVVVSHSGIPYIQIGFIIIL